MVSRETIIQGNGLDATRAAKVVQVCSKFESEITFKQGSRNVNAKSIMGVISLALQPDDSVTILTEGKDEKEALKEVLSCLKNI